MKSILLGVVIIVFAGPVSFAQSDAQTFQSKSVTNMRSGQQHPYVCSFRIVGDDKVEWIQGEQEQTFSITSREGKVEKGKAGKATYHLNMEGRSGKISIETSVDGEVVLTLDLSDGGSVGSYLKFDIEHL